ncbi:uncharacterized protein LOC142631421 [Castanea sativa]|uniref:uncharacterized protein LOC142631421 n=1 Tax=Castanea sativa TaxID=21020 RepID=UPI003F64A48C
MYNDRTELVEYVSHFNQRMVVHSKNETLMCKVFPSSLRPVVMRWFDGLNEGSINSFKKLTRAFVSRFVTCNRIPQPLDSLLSKTMRERETLKTYSDRYCEIFNEIDGNFDDVVVQTFKVDPPAEHDLRMSLTRKPVRSVRQLMDCIDKYKRVEEDQRQGKGKAKGSQAGSGAQRDASTRPPLGTISVILAAPGRTSSQPSRKHDDALKVTLRIGGYDVKRALVDQGNGAEIMYLDLYKGLKLRLVDLACYDSPLIGFNGKIAFPKGQIRLPVQTGLEVVEVNFIVVDAYSPYTAIVARTWLHTMAAVSSTLHLKEKEELVVFLRRNVNVFVWSAYEAPKMDPNFICHHLKINPSATPKKQPPRHLSKEHSDAVKEEATKLKRAWAIKEVFYSE